MPAFPRSVLCLPFLALALVVAHCVFPKPWRSYAARPLSPICHEQGRRADLLCADARFAAAVSAPPARSRPTAEARQQELDAIEAHLARRRENRDVGRWWTR